MMVFIGCCGIQHNDAPVARAILHQHVIGVCDVGRGVSGNAVDCDFVLVVVLVLNLDESPECPIACSNGLLCVGNQRAGFGAVFIQAAADEVQVFQVNLHEIALDSSTVIANADGDFASVVAHDAHLFPGFLEHHIAHGAEVYHISEAVADFDFTGAETDCP